MKLLIFAGAGDSSRAVANALSEVYDVSVILEGSVPMKTFLKRRIKKLGLRTVVGQILFRIIIPPYLNRKSKARIEEIKNQYNLRTDSFDSNMRKYRVDSINDNKVLKIVRKENPDIIVVNGTRIISKEILDKLTVPIINMHMGITPKYRGVHGGYWAIASGDKENCGVTIHKVDEGIDTGNIISQKRIKTIPRDNYVTYPYIQVGEGIALEKQILEEFNKTEEIKTYTVNLPSMLWTHPTITQYIRGKSRS